MNITRGALFLLLIGFAYSFKISTFDFDIEQSKEFQSYCVMTHCNKELLLNWNCKLCSKLTALQ